MICTTCKFDLGQHDAEGASQTNNGLQFTVKLDLSKAVSIELHCPMCGSEVAPRSTDKQLSDFNVVEFADHTGQRRRIRWVGSPALRHCQIEGVLELDAAELAYSAVPLFDQPQGVAVVPDLPIRGDYFGLIDLAPLHRLLEERQQVQAGRAPQREPTGPHRAPGLDAVLGHLRQDGKYVARVPLIGYPERGGIKEFVLPVIGKGFNRVATGSDGLRGVQLTMWPNVRTRDWRNFLVSARFVGDQGCVEYDLAKDKQYQVQLLTAVAQDGQPSAAFELIESAVNPLPVTRPFGQKLRYAINHTKTNRSPAARPFAIGVACNHPERAKAAGGYFLVPPAKHNKPPQSGQDSQNVARSGQNVSIGLDFGTSNSCVAFKPDPLSTSADARAAVLPLADLNLYLVNGVAATVPVTQDTYVPGLNVRGFGQSADLKSLLPTELFTVAPIAEALVSAVHAKSLVPGVDYGLADVTVQLADIGRPEPVANYLADGFKWKRDLGGRHDDDHRPVMIQLYARALMLVHLANYYSALERSTQDGPSRFEIHFSYPGRWSVTERSGLSEYLGEACTRPQSGDGSGGPLYLSDWLAPPVSVQPANVDEALAATIAIQQGREIQHSTRDDGRYYLELVVDVGGGSTDIAAFWTPRDGTSDRRVEQLTSLRYAGNDAFAALRGRDVQTRALHPNLSDHEVLRQLRTRGVAESLFHEGRKPVRQRKLTAFYWQLIELISRTIAAVALNGRLQKVDPGARALLAQICFAGNGWGLAQLEFGADFQGRVCTHVADRVEELLTEGGSTLRLATSAGSLYRTLPSHIRDPKFLVALGVLEGQSNSIQYEANNVTESDLAHHGGSPSPKWEQREIAGLPIVVGEVFVPWHEIVQNDASQKPASVEGTVHWRRLQLSYEVISEQPGGKLASPLVFNDAARLSVSSAFAVDAAQVRQQVCQNEATAKFLSRGLLHVLLENGLRKRLIELT